VKLFLRLPRLEKLREVLSRGGLARGEARRMPGREVLVIAAVAVASAVITLIVLTVSFNSRERRSAAQARESQVSLPAPQTEEELSVSDFLLPAAPPADKPAEYYPFRPRLLRWSRENVEKFWVSPRQIATDTISAINDRNLESMFEKVP